MNGLSSQILIISPEPWNGHFVSKHHYAVTLVKEGYEVYFLNPPENGLKDINIIKTKYDKLWEVSAPQVAKGLRFYPGFLRNYVERKWLERLESHIGKSFTSIWLFENSRFYDMNFAGERTKIYHQVDSNQDFHIKEAGNSADICFCVTEYIQQDLQVFSNKVFKILHGINILNYKASLTIEEKNRFTEDTINVIYLGNLNMKYIDENILYELALKHQNIIFHFIGNYNKNSILYRKCKNIENIIWWGSVKSELIPMILEYIDITLLVYRAEKYKKQLANSHKILEYLASEKVTVATYTDEYKDKRELLEMVDNSESFIDKFNEVVNHLSHYNSQEKQKMRSTFAKEHSYEKQLEKIKYYLNQYNLEL
jgi:hypothetical protein